MNMMLILAKDGCQTGSSFRNKLCRETHIFTVSCVNAEMIAVSALNVSQFNVKFSKQL